MELHCVLADPEAEGDSSVGVTVGKAAEDVEFARRERFIGRLVSPLERVVYDEAGGDSLNRREELTWSGIGSEPGAGVGDRGGGGARIGAEDDCGAFGRLWWFAVKDGDDVRGFGRGKRQQGDDVETGIARHLGDGLPAAG